jgi:hypothetical protein
MFTQELIIFLYLRPRRQHARTTQRKRHVHLVKGDALCKTLVGVEANSDIYANLAYLNRVIAFKADHEYAK